MVLLVVDKSCQTLRRYHYGKLARTYHIVIGRKSGTKLYEGDKRTPTGLYMIIEKRPHARWSRFLLLDYPTPFDLQRYQQAVIAGLVPVSSQTDPGAGGAIGLHGTDEERLNTLGFNWTLGCISLHNPDIEELFKIVPLGTLVYIKE